MALRIPILAGLALCLRWHRRSLAQAAKRSTTRGSAALPCVPHSAISRTAAYGLSRLSGEGSGVFFAFRPQTGLQIGDAQSER
jgi:hypothetical protein